MPCWHHEEKSTKVIGQSLLTLQELDKVLLDVEMTIKNRLLMYQGETSIPVVVKILEVGSFLLKQRQCSAT